MGRTGIAATVKTGFSAGFECHGVKKRYETLWATLFSLVLFAGHTVFHWQMRDQWWRQGSFQMQKTWRLRKRGISKAFINEGCLFIFNCSFLNSLTLHLTEWSQFATLCSLLLNTVTGSIPERILILKCLPMRLFQSPWLGSNLKVESVAKET